MAEKALGKAKPNQWTRLKIAFYDTWERMGLGPFTTKIHNESGSPILLIPVRYTRHRDGNSTWIIEKDLAMIIEANEVDIVDCSQYDYSNKHSPKIQILFRAGKDSRDLTKFLDNHGHVQLEKGETPYRHNFLYEKRDLYLTSADGKKVMEIKNAGQDGEKGKNDQAKPTAQSSVTQEGYKPPLIEKIEKLEKDVSALMSHMKKLDPSFSPSTPSSSK